MKAGTRSHSIRYKLLASVLLTSIAAVVLTVAVLLVNDLHGYQQSYSDDLSTQAELMGRANATALQFDDAVFATSTLSLLQARPGVRAAAIYTVKGALFARYLRSDLGEISLPALPEVDGIRITGERIVVWKRIVAEREILGTIYLEADFDARQRALQFAGVAFGVALLALLVSVLLAAWIQARLTRPILDVSRVARQVVDARDYRVRAHKSSDDEVGVLVDAFNDMLAEIERRAHDMATANASLEREIAERQLADQAQRESEERYRSLVVATAQIVWSIDAQGRAGGPMPAWQTYTGQTDGEILGEGWLRGLHADDMAQAVELWRRALASQSLYETEFRIRRRDGEYRWFSIRGVPVMRMDGTIREWVGTCTDIHQRRLAELDARRLNEELEQRVRERTAQLEGMNRELEAFSYSVSHDLRAPLRAVVGFSQALIEDHGEQVNADMRRYLDRIRTSGLRMGQLIEDLLNLSRISRIELLRQPVDLSDIAQQVTRELQQREPEREVDVSIWDGVAALGDPRLLRVALENLLGNAWKFTSKTPLPRIELGMLQEGARTVYFVRDNGAGFDMSHATKLFGAFQRLHAVSEFQGTGIGLATVQRIVSRHGGQIWANAQPGKGAAFFFTLGEDTQAPPRVNESDIRAPGGPT